jgi:hypothetical protein
VIACVGSAVCVPMRGLLAAQERPARPEGASPGPDQAQ